MSEILSTESSISSPYPDFDFSILPEHRKFIDSQDISAKGNESKRFQDILINLDLILIYIFEKNKSFKDRYFNPIESYLGLEDDQLQDVIKRGLNPYLKIYYRFFKEKFSEMRVIYPEVSPTHILNSILSNPIHFEEDLQKKVFGVDFEVYDRDSDTEFSDLHPSDDNILDIFFEDNLYTLSSMYIYNFLISLRRSQKLGVSPKGALEIAYRSYRYDPYIYSRELSSNEEVPKSIVLEIIKNYPLSYKSELPIMKKYRQLILRVRKDLESEIDNVYLRLLSSGMFIRRPIKGHWDDGEWDWFHNLSKSERKRLLRKWIKKGYEYSSVDCVSESFKGGIEEWLELTRMFDYYNRILRGKRVDPASFGYSQLYQSECDNLSQSGYKKWRSRLGVD